MLFSKDTPTVYLKKIQGGYCEQFEPLFLTDEETRDFRLFLVNYIRSNYYFDSWITTRLDNDDAIPLNFIEEIQRCAFQKIGDYAISFPDGYQYDVHRNVLAKYHFPNNHFTTYVTETRDKTIYDFGHINLTSQIKVEYIKQHYPMWVEIIHGMNVYNRMGTLNPLNYIRKENLRERFGVDIVVSKSPAQLIWWYLYFAVSKGWNKRARIGIYLRRKLHIRYEDDRTDR